MLKLTRAEILADIAEFTAIVNQEIIPDCCLGCGAKGHRNPNGGGSLCHKRLYCRRQEGRLLAERREDLAFLGRAQAHSKFEE